jgi:hypothetical protein
MHLRRFGKNPTQIQLARLVVDYAFDMPPQTGGGVPVVDWVIRRP